MLARSVICLSSTGLAFIQHCRMHLQEFCSKQLLKNHGLTVQRFVIINSVEELYDRLQKFTANEFVVKAQVMAGGRGKGHFDNGLQGGVHLTKKLEEVAYLVDRMLGQRLITKQTGPAGVLVHKVMIAESVPIIRESYVAMMLDRTCNAPVVVASPAGGMDIEEVAVKHPEKIMKIPIDLSSGFCESDATAVAEFLGFSKSATVKAIDQLLRLYEAFVKTDAVMMEVNPFCETEGDEVYVVDAKLQFDDNAAYRQKEIFQMRDTSEADPREREAEKHNLNFVGLDGNIGCLVNGAGLAMATMDLIKVHGGQPANFLDIGGGVEEQQVVAALRILSSDAKVKAILVNIFGGIVNCDTIARGLVAAFKRTTINVPTVVRLEGTNVIKARKTLQQSHLPFFLADSFESGVQMAVQAVAGN